MGEFSKNDLQQYVKRKWRIAAIEDELANGDFSTRDSVSGSQTSFPYTQRTFVISGQDVRRKEELESSLCRLEAKCRRAEQFVDGVEDDSIQALLRLHYLQGLSWPKVRQKLRARHLTANALRMQVERFLRKF